MFKRTKSLKTFSKTFFPALGLSLSKHGFLVDLCLETAVNHVTKM